MAIDKDKIEALKRSVNIVDVISEVTPLTKAGRHYLGLCPFHKEKTPSFNVVEDKQFYHCFGCGKSGDVFRFLEDTQQISFIEAVQRVAERSDIDLGLSVTTSQRKKTSPHQPLYDINGEATSFYHAILMTTTQGQQARQYLADRGLTEELLKYFQLGLAVDEPNYLYQRLVSTYDEQVMGESGLFVLTESNQMRDSFRNRIIFPLHDEWGRAIGFSGRIWQVNHQDQAKYKNTRSTPIFNKSEELYHLDKAKATIQKTKEVYLMEGFMDVIAAYRAGVTNVVATMGTALTAEHVQRLKKYAQKIILTYDGDAAGQAAIAKSLALLDGFQVDIVTIPNQMDPDDYLQKNSPEALAKLLTQSRISQIEFLSRYWLPENIDNLQAQIAYLERMAQLIAQEPSLTAQNTYITMVADLLPAYDYLQVEHVVNDFRLRKRGQKEQFAPQGVALFPSDWQRSTGQLSVVGGLEGLEQQLFYRLLTNDHLLAEVRFQTDFHFSDIRLDRLYRILLDSGEISSLQLADLPEDLSQAYYRVLERQFPEKMADNELEDLLARRDYYLGQQHLNQTEKAIREHSKQGDLVGAEAALAALITQKRHLE